jgi:hypothetical protein
MAKSESTRRRYKATTAGGSACQAIALPESDYCFFHDPSRTTERRDAQAQGGRQNHMKTLNATVPDVKVEDCGYVVALISETINHVRKGMIDPRVANAVGYLANVLIKALEQDELETRIERLEALLETRIQAPDLTMTLLAVTTRPKAKISRLVHPNKPSQD